MFLDNDRVFFASANTVSGFRSYFGEIFNPEQLQKIYIIKGGSGTGKSGMMKKIGAAAKKAGLTVDTFLCSSDPDSLDGVLIREKKIAILDGTFPHTTDPKYPGVVEELVNTGAFWDEEILAAHREEIISLIRDKGSCYKKATQFLKAVGEIALEILWMGARHFKHEKMNRAAVRIADRLFKPEDAFREEIRLVSSLNGGKRESLSTFQSLSKDVTVIQDHCFSAPLFLERIYQAAKESGQSVVKSYSALFPEKPGALYFPKLEACFVVGERDYDAEEKDKLYHYVNMQRFFDLEALKQNKQKLKFAKKCCDALLDGAAESFRDAAALHAKIEAHYKKAMDFTKIDQLTEELIGEIL